MNQDREFPEPEEVNSGLQRIVVPFGESDLQDLMDGEELLWVFKLNGGEHVELLLRQETQEDIEGIKSY
jgi:hypothetical protein